MMTNDLKDAILSVDRRISYKAVPIVPQVTTHVDKVLRWVPAALMIVSRPVGWKTKHGTLAQSLLLLTSTGILNAFVVPVKRATSRARPTNPFDLRSFPSNHTATAFVGAELLRQELKENYKVLPWLSYGIAGVTGVMRICKRRHWFSDVVSGAVIGLAAAYAGRAVYRKAEQLVKRASHNDDSGANNL